MYNMKTRTCVYNDNNTGGVFFKLFFFKQGMWDVAQQQSSIHRSHQISQGAAAPGETKRDKIQTCGHMTTEHDTRANNTTSVKLLGRKSTGPLFFSLSVRSVLFCTHSDSNV